MALLNSVLTSLPVHVVSCMAIPKKVQKRLDVLMGAFLWSQREHRSAHWVSWRKVCQPISAGGLGVRSVSDMITGLHGKLA